MKAPTPNYRPRLQESKRPMTKEEFIIEYVFRRAITQRDSLDGEGAAKMAADARDLIQRKKEQL